MRSPGPCARPGIFPSISFVFPWNSTDESAESGNRQGAKERRILASDTSLGEGWIGSIGLSSNFKLATVTEITWEGGSASDGLSAGAYQGSQDGVAVVYLASLP